MSYGKLGGMMDIINEDVKCIPVWYKCAKFYTFARCFSLFIVTELVILFNIQFTKSIISGD